MNDKVSLLRTGLVSTVIGVLIVTSGCQSTQTKETTSQIQIDERYAEFKQQAQARMQKGQLRTDSRLSQCQKAKADLRVAQQKGHGAQIKANSALIAMLCAKEKAEHTN